MKFRNVLMGITVCLLIACTAFAGRSQNGVDWDAGNGVEIQATGIGLPGKFKGSQGRVMARRAAITDAYRELLAQINEIRVDAETLMKEHALKSDIVRTKISGFVRGAKIVNEGMEEDGVYYVTMSIPMYGENSLASVAVPEIIKAPVEAKAPAVVTAQSSVMTTEKFTTAVNEINRSTFSGIVVDASGMGLECTMAPQIIDSNGRVIYGKENIDLNFAVSHGLVEYTKDIEKARSGATRAGARPVIFRALAVKGGSNSVNPVNVVVSPEDADKILILAASDRSIMKKGLIVFVR